MSADRRIPSEAPKPLTNGAPHGPSPKADWVIPAGLIALATIPVVAGMVRLTMPAGHPPVTPDNARFMTSPVPSSAPFGSRQGSSQMARLASAAGRVIVVAGLVAALSGLCMAMFYAIVPADDWLLDSLRLLAGSAMALSIVLAVLATRRRDIRQHQDWMRRAYAIGLGAGTQALIQLPPLLLLGPPDPLSLALMMSAGWGINVVVAE